MRQSFNHLPRPIAAAGSAFLAAVALGACGGGGDKSFDYRLVCKEGTHLEVSDVDEILDSQVTLECLAPNGTSVAPRIQAEGELGHFPAEDPQYDLHLVANGRSNSYTNEMFRLGPPEVDFSNPSYFEGRATRLEIDNMNELEAFEITPVPRAER